jgi:hypothetical protein
MTDPSPATASIVQAFDDRYELLGPFEANWQEICLAAALRAAADQCKIEWNYHPDYPETESVIIVSDLLAIAAELEAQ